MNTIVRKITLICVLFLCVAAGFSQASRQLVMEEGSELPNAKIVPAPTFISNLVSVEAVDDTGEYILVLDENLSVEYLWGIKSGKCIRSWSPDISNAGTNNGSVRRHGLPDGVSFYLEFEGGKKIYFSKSNVAYKIAVEKLPEGGRTVSIKDKSKTLYAYTETSGGHDRMPKLVVNSKSSMICIFNEESGKIVCFDTVTKHEYKITLLIRKLYSMAKCFSEDGEATYFASNQDGVIKKFDRMGNPLLDIMPYENWVEGENGFCHIHEKDGILYVVISKGAFCSQKYVDYDVFLYDGNGKLCASYEIPFESYSKKYEFKDTLSKLDLNRTWNSDEVYINQRILLFVRNNVFVKYDFNAKQFSWVSDKLFLSKRSCVLEVGGVPYAFCYYKNSQNIAAVNLETFKVTKTFTIGDPVDGEGFRLVDVGKKLPCVLNFYKPGTNRIHRSLVIDKNLNVIQEFRWSREAKLVFATSKKLVAEFDGQCVFYDLDTKSVSQNVGGVESILLDGKESNDFFFIRKDSSLSVYDFKNVDEVATFLSADDFHRSKYYSLYLYMDSKGFILKDFFDESDFLTFEIFSTSEYMSYTPEGFFSGTDWAYQNLAYAMDGWETAGLEQLYEMFYRPDLLAEKLWTGEISSDMENIRISSVLKDRPPEVTFTDFRNESEEEDFTFEFSVKDCGGGIGEVYFVLNGIVRRLHEGLDLEGRKSISFSHTVSLDEGENTIEVYALNSSGTIESPRISECVTWHGEMDIPNLYVLTLGINEYKDGRLKLKYAVPDAEAVAEKFREQEGLLYKNVYVTPLFDNSVTRQGINDAFKELSTRVKPNDVFVLYVAGHGTVCRGDYYYIPVNFRSVGKNNSAVDVLTQGISKKDLLSNFSMIDAGRTLVLFDTCNSGAALGFSDYGYDERFGAMNRMKHATGHAIFAGADSDQTALEGYDGHGVFTYVLLEGLSGKAEDMDCDWDLSVWELANHVRKYVPEKSYEKYGKKQKPQVETIRDFTLAKKLRDDFVLVEGGTFQMGSESKEEWFDDEEKESWSGWPYGPYGTREHTVKLDSFYICNHQVTQKEYESVMGKNPSFVKGDDRPVEDVSWYDAIEYCNALSLMEGFTPCYTIDKENKDPNNIDESDELKWTVTCDFDANGYRLPTSAEWEYAARGGNKSRGYAYSGSNDLRDVYPNWEDYEEYEGLYPVKTTIPNELGLYDMSGYVSDMCWDWYYGDYPDAEQTNPLGVMLGDGRVVRGMNFTGTQIGSILSLDNSFCRISAAFRSVTPSVSEEDVSFRVVRSYPNITREHTPFKFFPSEVLIEVEGGTFQMGSEDEDDYASPVHSVTLDSFYICDHEVTNIEFNSVMRNKNYGGFYPAEASWYDAVEFCNMLSVLEGLTPCYNIDKENKDLNNTNENECDDLKWTVTCDFDADGYRLPTEAEWEYAARGGSKSKGYKYSGSDVIDDVAWYGDNSGYEPHVVKTKSPNELGLYDMTGNVEEWCWDWWYDEYPESEQENPLGASSGSDRVARGGVWGYESASYCSVCYRSYDYPYDRGIYLGFRVVRSRSDVKRTHTPFQEPAPIYPTMVSVDGGTFQMGSEEENDYASPVHSVTLDSFNICDHEVTQKEYKRVMKTNPSNFVGNDKPVENVSWYDAVVFCNKLSEFAELTPCYTLNGSSSTENWGEQSNEWSKIECDFNASGYRLPTEAEWEYAARGGNKSKGYKYSGSDVIDDVAWPYENDSHTHDVKTKSPNELGLYDMTGNVSEWCWGKYSEYGFWDTLNPLGMGSSNHRIHRGGGWNSDVFDRTNLGASEKDEYCGFRIVQSIGERKTSPEIITCPFNSDKTQVDEIQPELSGLHFEQGHTSWVYSVAFSPDGKYIASGDSENIAIVWDVKSGRELRLFHTEDNVACVAFSPDGKYVGTSGEYFHLWDIQTGKELWKSGELSGSFAFSPDGKYIASGFAESMYIYDAETGKKIKNLEGLKGHVQCIAYSSDGKYIAAGAGLDDGAIHVWNAETGEEIRKLSVYNEFVGSIVFSPDGKYIAGAEDYENEAVTIWEVKTGKTFVALTDEVAGKSICCIVYTPDGKRLAITSNYGEIIIFDVVARKVVKIIKTGSPVESITYSPDGMYIAYASWDGSIHICDEKNGTERAVFGKNVGSISDAVWSPDGETFGCVSNSYSDKSVRVWKTNDATVKNILTPPSSDHIKYSPDGKHITDSLYVWNVEGNYKEKRFKTASSYYFAYSPDGKMFASCIPDGANYITHICEVETGKEVFVLNRDKYYLSAITYSPDGKYVVGGYVYGCEIIWDAKTGEELFRFGENGIRDLMFTTEGKYLCCSYYDKILMYETESFTLSSVIYELTDFQCISNSPDGKIFALGGNKTIHLYDIEKKQIIKSIDTDGQFVYSLSFSPDGRHLLSSRDDGTIVVYDVATGNIVYTIHCYKNGEYIVRTPEGFFTGSEWACKNLVYWIGGLEAYELNPALYDALHRPDLIEAKIRGEDISAEARKIDFSNPTKKSVQNGLSDFSAIEPIYPTMVLVDGGTFQMGSDEEDFGASPVHSVTLDSFYICDHEVTQKEYFRVIGENPSWFEGENRPVECVDWYNAIEYCNALSMKEGLTPCYTIDKENNESDFDYLKWTVSCDFDANGYRLPTEAEWEYAARGGNRSKRYKYSGSDDVSSVAWYEENACEVGGDHPDYGTHDVKTKLQNELGLYDMSGNVFEWCWDWYGGYETDERMNSAGASSGSDRVTRGGSWDWYAPRCRVAIRSSYSPSYSYFNVGFRVVRSSSKDKRTHTSFQEPAKAGERTEGEENATEPILPTMVSIDGGTFQMGSEENDYASPVHSVTVDSFYMCEHEITQSEYQSVMGKNPSDFKGDDRPVENVSWYDAIEYCNALSEKAGLSPCYKIDKENKDPNNTSEYDELKWTVTCDFDADGYRLPTEAEWEYSARGGSKSKGYKYSGSDVIEDVAWYDDNACDGVGRDSPDYGTHAVKTKKANELGLYDMSGNVWEWCWDRYGLYSSSSQENPLGPASGSYRVLRGGSWCDYASICRVADRFFNGPSYSRRYIGFRVVRSSSKAKRTHTSFQEPAKAGESNCLIPKDRELYAKAQKWRTEEPDSVMLEVKNGSIDQLRKTDVERYISEVVNVINKNAVDDFQKIKMINDIICLTISYDQESLMSGDIPDQSYGSVLSSGMSVCEGFADVFNKLCAETGIECKVVHGYARGAGTSLQSDFEDSKNSNHAWNIITINGRDYLIDSTWNEGARVEGVHVKDYNTEWLFVSPEIFAYTHFPDDEKDQLLDSPLSREDFCVLPSVRPYFFDEVESWSGNLQSITECDGNLDVVFSMLDKTPDMSFSVTDLETLTELENSHFFVQESPSTWKLMLSFPKEGLYKINLFDNGHEKQRDLGEFLVRSTGESNTIFPKIYNGSYGIKKGGVLNSPLSGPLKRGDTVFFSVQSKRSAVEVLIDDAEADETVWIPLEDKGNGLYEGNVLIPVSAKSLEVDAKEGDGTSYCTLVKFELEGELILDTAHKLDKRFLKTYGSYGKEKGGVLNSPLSGPLKRGDKVFFSVQSKRSAVEVLIDDAEAGETVWIPLEDKGNGLYEGNVLIPVSAKSLEVDAKEEDGTSYCTLVEFELE